MFLYSLASSLHSISVYIFLGKHAQIQDLLLIRLKTLMLIFFNSSTDSIFLQYSIHSSLVKVQHSRLGGNNSSHPWILIESIAPEYLISNSLRFLHVAATSAHFSYVHLAPTLPNDDEFLPVFEMLITVHPLFVYCST